MEIEGANLMFRPQLGQKDLSDRGAFMKRFIACLISMICMTGLLVTGASADTVKVGSVRSKKNPLAWH